MTAPAQTPPKTPPPPEGRTRGRVTTLVYRGVGLAALGLATAGVFLPLLPTTPFLLVAVWAFARGAPELGAKLYAHPRFGPFLRDWDERRAIPLSGKIASVVGMSLSWALLYTTAKHPAGPIVGGLVMLGVAAYVVTRPSA